ncbi:MAG: xanthine dehydrogenase accessory protein XdhC [Microbacterium sp.]|uniref:xanthine dehydrogenase accessory protein XdhC n=1 Tax=Microbacterium sp. TaxID=51671 RepID=UPI003F9DFE20
MDWLDALQRLRLERTPAVVVTLAMVRGHAPRNGGAKMVVSPDDVFGTIGGGNLEATAIDRAREMLGAGSAEPELLTLTLSDKAVTEYGVQCCGGEVTMMLEPMRVIPAVAVFGVGHVGLELARILARHELDLYLIDSRAEMLAPERVGVPGQSGILADAVARVHVTHSPVPEAALVDLPPGTHVLVMTHDHVEDLAIVDQSLRAQSLGTGGLGSIGLIGSASKWARFRKKLLKHGHIDDDLVRVTTPIGVPEVAGKQPAVIAVSVAARILQLIDESAAVAVSDATASDSMA